MSRFGGIVLDPAPAVPSKSRFGGIVIEPAAGAPEGIQGPPAPAPEPEMHTYGVSPVMQRIFDQQAAARDQASMGPPAPTEPGTAPGGLPMVEPPPPERGFVAGVKHGYVGAMPAGLVAGGDATKERYAMQRPPEGPAAGLGAFAGTLPSTFIPGTNPLHNAMILAQAIPGASVISALPERAAAGIKTLIAATERAGGARAAAALEHAIEAGGINAANAALETGLQERWQEDPVGAAFRTFHAAAIGGAQGVAFGGTVGGIGGKGKLADEAAGTRKVTEGRQAAADVQGAYAGAQRAPAPPVQEPTFTEGPAPTPDLPTELKFADVAQEFEGKRQAAQQAQADAAAASQAEQAATAQRAGRIAQDRGRQQATPTGPAQYPDMLYANQASGWHPIAEEGIPYPTAYRQALKWMRENPGDRVAVVQLAEGSREAPIFAARREPAAGEGKFSPPPTDPALRGQPTPPPAYPPDRIGEADADAATPEEIRRSGFLDEPRTDLEDDATDARPKGAKAPDYLTREDHPLDEDAQPPGPGQQFAGEPAPDAEADTHVPPEIPLTAGTIRGQWIDGQRKQGWKRLGPDAPLTKAGAKRWVTLADRQEPGVRTTILQNDDGSWTPYQEKPNALPASQQPPQSVPRQGFAPGQGQEAAPKEGEDKRKAAGQGGSGEDRGAGGVQPDELLSPNTSARKADMSADRAAMGLDELDPAKRKSWEQVLESAKTEGIPERADQLAQSVIEKPRALSDKETAGVVVRAAQLKNQHRGVLAEIAGLSDPARLADKAAELEDVQRRFDDLSYALRTSGTEKGRALAAQKLTIGQDYDLVSIRSRAKAAKGKPLTEKEAEPLDAIARRIQNVQKEIAALEAKAAAPASLPAKKPAPASSPELDTLLYRRDTLRKQLKERIDNLRPRSFWTKYATEPTNFTRALMTSFDLSATLRQGGFVALGHPARAARAFGPMLRALVSPTKSAAINRAIGERPNAPLYHKYKLSLTEVGGNLLDQEEKLMSRFAVRIPGVAGSQRAYTTFLNTLRADSFDAMAETLGRSEVPTPAELKAIANYINVATGRGTFNQTWDQAAVPLAQMFFAPRLVMSRFQLLANPLTGFGITGGSARVRGMVAQEYARFLAGIGVVYGLGALSGAEIETDPRSSNFGKLQFGKSRLDPLAGLSQVTTFVSRELSGKSKNASGKLVNLRGDDVPFGSGDGASVLGRFIRTKLAPMPAMSVDLMASKNVVGEKVTPASAMANQFVPLSFRDIYGAMQEHGVAKGAALGILNLFGMNLQHYEAH